MYGEDSDMHTDNNHSSIKRTNYKSTGVQFIDASIQSSSSNYQPNYTIQYDEQSCNTINNLHISPPSPEITSGNIVIKGAYVPGHGYMQSGDHTNDVQQLQSQQQSITQSVPTQLKLNAVDNNEQKQQGNDINNDTIQLSLPIPVSTSTTDNDTCNKQINQQFLNALGNTTSNALPQQNISDNEDIGYRAWVAESPDGKWARYDKKLGSGTFKEVYLSVDTESGKEVAWNIVDLRRLTSSDIKRIRSETDLLTKLRHPHIIEIYDVFELTDSKQLCFITEKMSYTLKQHIANLYPAKNKVIKKYCRQILYALSYLHSFIPPIIHRDLKCDNIFIDGTTGDAKLGDFGLAIHQYSATSMIGTPGFMAPELFMDSYNELVDIWSFGMCVFEMVTNEFPYLECNGVVSTLLRKGYEGQLPQNINKIKDSNIREFIKICLQSATKRPSAKQLLYNTIFDLTEPNNIISNTNKQQNLDGMGIEKNQININNILNNDTYTQSQHQDTNTNTNTNTSTTSTMQQHNDSNTHSVVPEPNMLLRDTSGTGNNSDATQCTGSAAPLKLADDESHRLDNKRRAEQLITKVDVVKTDNPAVVSISLHCLLPKLPVNILINPIANDTNDNTSFISELSPVEQSNTNAATNTDSTLIDPSSVSPPLEFEQKQILIPSYDFSKDNYITVATQLVKTMNELKQLEIDHLEEYIASRIELSTKRYYDKWSSKHRSTQNSEIMTLLSSLGINLSYSTKLIEQEVSIDDLFLLSDNDLQEFLPKLGPRRRMQQYLDNEREKRKLINNNNTDINDHKIISNNTIIDTSVPDINTNNNDTIQSATMTTPQSSSNQLPLQAKLSTNANDATQLQYYSDVPSLDKTRRRKSSVDDTEIERVAEREKRKLKQNKQKAQYSNTNDTVQLPTNSDDDKLLNKLLISNKTINNHKSGDITAQPQSSPTSSSVQSSCNQSCKFDSTTPPVQPTILDENVADELLHKREKLKSKQLTQKRERQRLEKLIDEVKRTSKLTNNNKNGYEESEEQSDEHNESIDNNNDTIDSPGSTSPSSDDTNKMLSANLLLRKRLHKMNKDKRQLDNITEEYNDNKSHTTLEHVTSMPELNRQYTPDTNTTDTATAQSTNNTNVSHHTLSAPVSPSQRTAQPTVSSARPTVHTPTQRNNNHYLHNTTATTITNVNSPVINTAVSPNNNINKSINSVKSVTVITNPVRKYSDTTNYTSSLSRTVQNTNTNNMISTGNISPSNKLITEQKLQQIHHVNKQATFLDDGDSGMNALLSKITTELGSNKSNNISTQQPQPGSPRMHAQQQQVQQRRNSDHIQSIPHNNQQSSYTHAQQPPIPRQHSLYDNNNKPSQQQPIPQQQFQSRAFSAIPIQPSHQSTNDLSLTRSLSQTNHEHISTPHISSHTQHRSNSIDTNDKHHSSQQSYNRLGRANTHTNQT